MRRRLLWAALGVAVAGVALAALLGAFSVSAVAPAPSDMLMQASDGLDEISIVATLDPAASTLTVTQQLTLENRTGQAQSAAVLRTWPNAFQTEATSPCATDEYDCYPSGFSMGALVMEEATVNGQSAAYRYQDEAKTVLLVPADWQAGARITLTLRYTVHVPNAAYRFGVQDGLFALGNAFAIPAVWADGAYRTDEYTAIGDPFLSDCANYALSLTVPEGYVAAGSAEPSVHTQGGQSTYQFEALAVRDLALVVGEGLTRRARVVDGTLLVAYGLTAKAADITLSYAQNALTCFNEAFGAYPYPSLTLAPIHFPMGGMEYPALIMLSADEMAAGDEAFELVVAHEVAHQWWYAVVGSDPVNQAWQDEALCEFSLMVYTEARRGRADREELRRTRLDASLRVTVPRGVTPGSPLDVFSSMSEYTLVVYCRGGAALCALDDAMGGTLPSFLRQYYARYAFSRATREDFETLLSEATGEDYRPLMTDYLDTYILN